MVADREDIIRRIKSLKEMAEHAASNPNEAAVAAAKASRLTLEYNIEQHELRPDEQQSYGRKTVGRVDARFQQQLLAIIADANLCKVVLFRGKGVRAEVIGRPSNIEVVDYLYHFMHRTVTRLARADWAKRVAEHNTQGATVSHHWTAFWYGAINAISMRLEEQAKENEADPTSQALIVVSDTELRQAMLDFYPDLAPSKKTKRIALNTDMWLSGWTAGATVTPNVAIPEQAGGK